MAMATTVLSTSLTPNIRQHTPVESSPNLARRNLNAGGRIYAADSSPRRTPNSFSKPNESATETGHTDKAFADHNSPATSKSDPHSAAIERVAEISKLPPDNEHDIISELTVVFLHNRVVTRAQLPFPHAASRETQNIRNIISEKDFKLTRLQESMIKTADMMESQQGPAIELLVARLPTSEDLPSTLTGIAREVFFTDVSDGVFWARLIAVFVFAGRVAVQCVKTEAGNYVSAIAVCLQKLILEHLHADIERLGGWDAFVAYCDRADQHLNASPAQGSRLRRFLTRLVTVAAKSTDLDSQVDGPASPQPLTSKVGWLAGPIAFGASALYDVFAGDSEL